jgi:hypothetical protein
MVLGEVDAVSKDATQDVDLHPTLLSVRFTSPMTSSNLVFAQISPWTRKRKSQRKMNAHY